jgi:uncharacterized membrane protein YgaE (UPF0421/DUF939 family)
MNTKNLILYAAKCITGWAIILIFSKISGYKDISWCLISVLLVLSPDSKEAIPLAMSRIKANLTGALSSAICLTLGSPTFITVSLAFILTIGFCYLAKIMVSSRSALVAVIIVMFHNAGYHLWDTALERILLVVSGCLLGLLITYLFHRKIISKEESPEVEPDSE